MQNNLTAGEEVAGYRIEALIAKGGMAVVYCARDTELDRRVALKVMAAGLAEDEKFRRRFVRESQLAASIEHPNIIPVYEAGQVDDLLYLAMRYVDGMDLSQLLRQERPIDFERALELFTQVADALDAAHSRGLVHRDVKPGNILVASGSGREDPDHVYLSDFGLTKRASSLSGLTAVGYVVGTVDYIAPEQVTGEAVDGRADIYALGCVMYQAFTGRRPFEREIDAATLYAHVSEPPPAVTAVRPDLPGELDRVIAKAMAKDPGDRYQTGRELIDDLRAVHAASDPTYGPRITPPAASAPVAPPLIPGPAPRPPISDPALLPVEPQPAPVTDDAPPRRRRRAPLRALLVGVIGVLAVAVAGVFAVRALEEPEVTLHFPVERYTNLGVDVYRTWTLTGSDGNELRGELVVVPRGSGPIGFQEVIPPSMTGGAEETRAIVEGKEVYSSNLLNIPVARTPSARQTITYELTVAEGPLTVQRLHEWAVEQANARGVRETPLTVEQLRPSPLSVSVVAGATAELPDVRGLFDGRPATTEEVGRLTYQSQNSEIATVDDGLLQGVSPGTTSVTIYLGKERVAVPVEVTQEGQRA